MPKRIDWSRYITDRRRRHPEAGSTFLEMAITVMLLLVMLFGVIDFGRALYVYHFLSNAARTATRWASVNGHSCGPGGPTSSCPSCDKSCNGTPPMNNGPAKDTDVTNYVKNLVPPGIDSSKISVTVCGTESGTECAESVPAGCATTPNADGCAVKVTVGYSFPFLIPLVRKATIPMTSTSEMVIAH